MMFLRKRFSNDGSSATLVTLDPSVDPAFGTYDHMSELDRRKLRAAYGCPEQGDVTTTTTPSTSTTTAMTSTSTSASTTTQ